MTGQVQWRKFIDHLIPRELGGADRIENLWPFSEKVRPYNAHRKAFLTQRLIVLIAGGQMSRMQAQREIAADWISCYVDHLGMVYLK